MIKSRNKILNNIRRLRRRYIEIFIDNSYDISKRVHDIMNDKEIDQKSLALLLDKRESEISKWMSGSHNFTLKTLAKLEEALDEKIINVVRSEKREEITMTEVVFINNPYCYQPQKTKLSTSKRKTFKSNYLDANYYADC